MVTFIDQHREMYGVEPICAVLPIAPSTYFRRKVQQQDPTNRSARAQRDDELRGHIQRVWDEQRAGLRPAEGLEAAAPRRHSRGALHGRAPDARDGPARDGARARLGRDHAQPTRRRTGRPISSIASLRRRGRISSGSPTSPTWRRGAASSTSPSSSTSLPAALSAGACRRRCAPISSSTRSSRRSTSAVGRTSPTWSITVIAARSICRCATPSDWPRPASRRRSAAAAIPMTMPWPNRSSACSKRRSFNAKAVAASRGRRICDAALGRLVQQPPAARTDWLRATG